MRQIANAHEAGFYSAVVVAIDGMSQCRFAANLFLFSEMPKISITAPPVAQTMTFAASNRVSISTIICYVIMP
jgi:hypothetical protein